ncbi:hypothetical protein BDF21DRAFT_413164 [Thamnidium elegans]|nr:hypothetical protein BDF21DRAFT_413164 [Thamnidium elegans]
MMGEVDKAQVYHQDIRYQHRRQVLLLQQKWIDSLDYLMDRYKSRQDQMQVKSFL